MIKYRDSASLKLSPTVVCLGFFDGVHLGHRAIITEGSRIARQKGLLLCVHTYDIPPERVLKHTEHVTELTSPLQKTTLLEGLGVEALVVSDFSEQLMHMPGADFFREILLGRLSAEHIVAGYNHRFGYRGDTGTQELADLCLAAGIGLSIVPAVLTTDGKAISSTAIRDALRRGDVVEAEAMLGHREYTR